MSHKFLKYFLLLVSISNVNSVCARWSGPYLGAMAGANMLRGQYIIDNKAANYVTINNTSYIFGLNAGYFKKIRGSKLAFALDSTLFTPGNSVRKSDGDGISSHVGFSIDTLTGAIMSPKVYLFLRLGLNWTSASIESPKFSDSVWIKGVTIGPGLLYRFTDNVHGTFNLAALYGEKIRGPKTLNSLSPTTYKLFVTVAYKF